MNSHHYDNALIIAPEEEGEYFVRYRKAFPEERFDVRSLEEIEEMFCLSLTKEGQAEIQSLFPGEIAAKRVSFLIKRLKKHDYVSPQIQALLPLRDELRSKGFLVEKEDSSSFFAKRPLIIRGYYEGKAIADALQELPNISLSWDYGRPIPRLAPLEPCFASNMEEATQLLLDAKRDLNSLPTLYAPGAIDLPDALKSLPHGSSPFLVPEQTVLVLQKEGVPLFQELDLQLEDEAMAELGLPNLAERQRRAAYQEKQFFCQPQVLCRIYLK